jgi:outer membrane protein TolC
LTGASVDGAVLIRALEMQDEVRSVDELEALALAQRPDLAAILNEVEAAGHAIEVAQAQWWPRLSVDLAGFLARDSLPSDIDWTGLFRVQLPLFEGGRIRADIADAFSFLREAKLRQALLQRSIRRDVEVAHTNLSTGKERVTALRLQLAAADEAFAQAEALYDAGLATNLERVTAQDQRLRTALALENAELELGIFQLDLLRATGTLHAWLGLERPIDPEGERAEAR